ncbi:hypothetical protein MC885_012474 [Smutsia gigantea]|nr:hypothetical protein MC885_012474 [Smutsia gigantea]
MFQAFPGDYDSGSRCSSSPSAESQYLSSVDSFGSPPTAAASQTSQDAHPNLTASLFTHSEVQVLGDPFPVVNPSYTSSFVLTCPEVSAFAGAQRTSGSDQPSDPLNSPSLLAL